MLSLGRIALSPALGYFVLSENYKLALTFFVLAGVSDMVGTKIKHCCSPKVKYSCILFQVDGYIARNFKGQSSHLGSVLDPLADKFLISILYVTLTMNGVIPGTYMSIPVPAYIGMHINQCNR